MNISSVACARPEPVVCDAPEGEPAAAAIDAAAARLLIVDDIADNRTLLRRRFERRGYQVWEADGGLKALEMIRTQPLDLVLLDWMMLDLDGPEVLRRIRQDRSAVCLPVIMATAKTQSEDVVQALALGANDYVTKPIDFAVCLARVETQIGRKRAEDHARAASLALARANENLERLVAERTEELSAANVRLRAAITAAEDANRHKDEFLSNISHELRTPLNGVLGMGQLLQRTQLSQQQQEMVGVITSSGDALQRVVTDLLDMVELGGGQARIVPCEVQLDQLLDEVGAEFRPQAQAKGLHFVLSAADDLAAVRTDPARLRQVLVNLLANAVKFTGHGQVVLTAWRDGDRVTFKIDDTGIGFDPSETERLFKRFHQADGSLSRAYGGVGLGLSIARELVELMGGRVRAEGRPGQGATFAVELPLPPI